MKSRTVTLEHSHLLLILAISFFVFANLSWLVRDSRPMPVVDSYTQASNVLRTVDAGWPKGPHEVSARIRMLSQGGRPPLYELTTIPFVHAFGRSEDAFAAVNLMYLAILMSAVFGLAKIVAGRAAGFAAMIAVASFPPIVLLMRGYRSYNGAFAAIAVTLFFLVLVLRDRKASSVWCGASACTAALLMHPLSVWVLVLPMAATWIWVTLDPRRTSPLRRHGWARSWTINWGRDPFVLKALMPAAILPIAATIWWYSIFGERFFRFSGLLRSGWLASFRDMEKMVYSYGWVPPDLRWYPLTSPFAISLPLAVGTGIAAIWLLLKCGLLGRSLALWLAASYVLLPTMAGFNWSYGSFALPIVAAVLGTAAAAVPSGWRRTTAVLAVVVISLTNFSIVTWGIPDFPGPMKRLWGVRERGQVRLAPFPAVENHWPISHVVADLVLAASEVNEAQITVFTFVPRVPHNLFGFTMLQHWPDENIRFAGTAAPYWGSPYPVDQLLESEFVIIGFPLSEACSSPATNVFVPATACFFQNPPHEFSASHAVVGQYRIPDAGVIELWKRTSEMTVEEIDSTLRTLDLEPKYTSRAVLLAASILQINGQSEDAVARLKAGAETAGQPAATSAEIWSELGLLYLKLGNNKAAIKACSKAVDLAPNHAAIHTRLGIIFVESGRIPEAKDALREAIRLAPDMTWPRQVLERLEASQD